MGGSRYKNKWFPLFLTVLTELVPTKHGNISYFPIKMEFPMDTQIKIWYKSTLIAAMEIVWNWFGEKMYKCPHCEKPGITALRKAFLSPGMPATCKSCGKPIGITYRSWIKAALPGAVVMIGAIFLKPAILMYALSLVGFALMMWFHLLFVPLIKEKSSGKHN